MLLLQNSSRTFRFLEAPGPYLVSVYLRVHMIDGAHEAQMQTLSFGSFLQLHRHSICERLQAAGSPVQFSVFSVRLRALVSKGNFRPAIQQVGTLLTPQSVCRGVGLIPFDAG